MRRAAVLVGAGALLVGCATSTPGGPGVTARPAAAAAVPAPCTAAQKVLVSAKQTLSNLDKRAISNASAAGALTADANKLGSIAAAATDSRTPEPIQQLSDSMRAYAVGLMTADSPRLRDVSVVARNAVGAFARACH